jgi:CRP-like cAMP-binding protein
MSVEHALLGRIQRENEMLTLTPVERFERFFKRSKHLLQIIPQKHIAAYLGMSPETLSRLKSKME